MLIEAKKFTYRRRDEEAYKVLKYRVNQYFRKRSVSKFANMQLVVKAIIIALTMMTSYALIISNLFSPAVMLLLAIVFGFASLMLGFNIGHDAAHNALSRNPLANRLLARSLEFAGASAYVWKIRHNLNHHVNSNIPEYDWTTYATKILTSNSNKFVSGLSVYSHLYTTFLYGFYFIFVTFYKDFEIFYGNRIGKACLFKPSILEQMIFPISKLMYVAIIFVLPIMFLTVSWWQVLLGLSDHAYGCRFHICDDRYTSPSDRRCRISIGGL